MTPDIVLRLTGDTAIMLHTSCHVNYQSALTMGGYMAEAYPSLARSFYEEAAQWRSMGEQIESLMPREGIERVNWSIVNGLKH